MTVQSSQQQSLDFDRIKIPKLTGSHFESVTFAEPLSEADEPSEKRNFLKKGEKSRKVYDPKQAIFKGNREKREQQERLEKHQTMFNVIERKVSKCSLDSAGSNKSMVRIASKEPSGFQLIDE